LFFVLVWWVLPEVVQSSLLDATEILHDGLQHMEVHRQTDTRKHSFAGLEHGHMMNARLDVRVRTEVVALLNVVHQDTAVVASYCGVAMLAEGQTAQRKAVVKASLARVFGEQLLVHGTNVVKVPRSELNDELENEVLTWEEKDSSAVQACC
jgi:hypothetical protein